MNDKFLNLDGLSYFKEKLDIELDNYATKQELNTELSEKANKVDNPTAGNLVSVDANGDLVDSGSSASGLYIKPSNGIPKTDLDDAVQSLLNNAQQVYVGQLNSVLNPKEGDICIIPAHNDQVTLEETSNGYKFVAISGTISWVCDTLSVTANNFNVSWQDDGGSYHAFFIPSNVQSPQNVTVGATIYITSEYPNAWEKIIFYNNFPALYYEYKSGTWEEREVLSDVLRYTQQNLTNSQKEQSRKNIDTEGVLISSNVTPPAEFSNKTREFAFTALGITSQQLTDLFNSKYAHIRFGDYNILQFIGGNSQKAYLLYDGQRYTLGYTSSSDYYYQLDKYELQSNKVTSISQYSTNVQIPSAKAVYDAIEQAATAGLSYDSVTESIIVDSPRGSYDSLTETIIF